MSLFQSNLEPIESRLEEFQQSSEDRVEGESDHANTFTPNYYFLQTFLEIRDLLEEINDAIRTKKVTPNELD